MPLPFREIVVSMLLVAWLFILRRQLRKPLPTTSPQAMPYMFSAKAPIRDRKTTVLDFSAPSPPTYNRFFVPTVLRPLDALNVMDTETIGSRADDTGRPLITYDLKSKVKSGDDEFVDEPAKLEGGRRTTARKQPLSRSPAFHIELLEPRGRQTTASPSTPSTRITRSALRASLASILADSSAPDEASTGLVAARASTSNEDSQSDGDHEVQIGDVFHHSDGNKHELWVREDGREGPYWRAVKLGYQRDDGLYLSLTPKNKEPSWVGNEWFSKRISAQGSKTVRFSDGDASFTEQVVHTVRPQGYNPRVPSGDDVSRLPANYILVSLLFFLTIAFVYAPIPTAFPLPTSAPVLSAVDKAISKIWHKTPVSAMAQSSAHLTTDDLHRAVEEAAIVARWGPVLLPDFALRANGGRIVPGLTSRPRTASNIGPDVVIDEELTIGRCWVPPIPGQTPVPQSAFTFNLHSGSSTVEGQNAQKDPAPSPPPPVAGAKRDLLEDAAHALENGKLPKLHADSLRRPPVETAMFPKDLISHVSLRMSSLRQTPSLGPYNPSLGRRMSECKPTAGVHGGYVYTPTTELARYGYQQGVPQAHIVPTPHPSGLHATLPMGTVAGQAAPMGVFAGQAAPMGVFAGQTAPMGVFGGQTAPMGVFGGPGNMPPATMPSPQGAEEAKLIWDRLDDFQKQEVLRLHQLHSGHAQPGGSDTFPAVLGGAVVRYEEPTVGQSHAIDGQLSPMFSQSDKGKGKAKETDDPMEQDHAEMGPSSRSNLDTMTNDFGMMLLNHIQDSHTQMNEMMADFMKKQNEAQERLRHSMANGFRAVHAKVEQIQNPVPLRGHRRNKPVAMSALQSTSPRDASTPPSTPRRARADRQRPIPSTPGADGLLTDLRSCVRNHLKTMLKFSTWKDLVSSHPPLTEDELMAFRTGRRRLTEENFRIDFIQDWKRHPFNLSARDIFVQNILRCIKGGGFDFDAEQIPLITEAHVESVLDGHMEYCRRKYREAYNLHTWNADDADDAEKIAEQEEKLLKEKRRKAINSRKQTLFDARLAVITEMGLERHMALFDRLLAQNMSGDETDGPQRKLPMIYRIIESRWQSAALKTFLRALDAMYRAAWVTPQPGQRATGGNAPRTRVVRSGGPIEEGYAPAGLWRNCYDQEWLRSLQPYQRRALKVMNADYEFDLTPERDEEDIPMHGRDESEDEVDEDL
ncbi:hypothetical protein C8Q79DRAFT_926398 [Trametes meyenii]|nr:hypothetical protein C8Q79DRAFT_926398 [Trametes meyenii]